MTGGGIARGATVLVTGGAGYVGAVLVPKLLSAGYRVRVLDLFLYGDDVFDGVRDRRSLDLVRGDLRDPLAVDRAMAGIDAVIHLACISNDPSFELDPNLGRSINLDAFPPLVERARKGGVRRFLYASSSSVYGVKSEPEVTEDLPLEPLTDYSRFKAECETILLEAATDAFVVTVIRPATVCGDSPRLRLDLTVNILTNHAVNKGEITVFGGGQKRPNLHIEDMTDLYLFLLDQPSARIQRGVYNAGYENRTVRDLAETVRRTLGRDLPIRVSPTDDNRSYHVSSEKIRRELGFVPRRTIEDAVRGLRDAFASGRVPDPLGNPRYFNIRTMQAALKEGRL